MSETKSVRSRTRKRGARGTVSTTSQVTGKEPEETINKEIGEPVNAIDPAYVRVDGGLTKNTGNYNSAKIGVSVSLPCEPNEQSVRECYSRASSLVDEFLDEEYDKAIGSSE